MSEEARCSPPNPDVCADSTPLGRGRRRAAGSRRTVLLCGQPRFPCRDGKLRRQRWLPRLSGQVLPPSALLPQLLSSCPTSVTCSLVYRNTQTFVSCFFPAIVTCTRCMAPCREASSAASGRGQAGSEFWLPGSDFLWPSISILGQQWGSADLRTCCATCTGFCRVNSFTGTNLKVEK